MNDYRHTLKPVVEAALALERSRVRKDPLSEIRKRERALYEAVVSAFPITEEDTTAYEFILADAYRLALNSVLQNEMASES